MNNCDSFYVSIAVILLWVKQKIFKNILSVRGGIFFFKKNNKIMQKHGIRDVDSI